MNTNNREAFEAWAILNGYKLEAVQTNFKLQYTYAPTAYAWQAWNAALSITNSKLVAYLWNDFGVLKVTYKEPPEPYAFPVYTLALPSNDKLEVADTKSFEYLSGNLTAEEVRKTDMYKRGDCIHIWVNEGEFYNLLMHQKD